MEPNHCLTCPDDIRGLCCHAAVQVDEVKFKLKDIFCEHLDEHKKCKIYHNRPKVDEWCNSVEGGILAGSLPDGCGYVKDIYGYKGWDVLPEKLEELVYGANRNTE